MKNNKIYLNNRKVLKVSGTKAVAFLNNILTADLSILKPNEVIASALLTPQGRILFDMLLSLEIKEHKVDYNSLLVECDELQLDGLFKRISLYNLRKEVNIEITDLKVFVINEIANDASKLSDKRFLNLQISRFYKVSLDSGDFLNYEEHESLNWYNFYRYTYCIAEGPVEISSGTSLPLEINFDLIGAISFNKGCFIGQEVNARIKWKGLIKKKYVPVELVIDNPTAKEMNLKSDRKIFFEDNNIGELVEMKYFKQQNNFYGLANIKLNYLYKFENDNSLLCEFQNLKMKINFPDYMLPLPKKL